MKNEKLKKGIQEDMDLATQLGARGTPSFFINGKNLRGAQPFASFKTAIDAAMKDAAPDHPLSESCGYAVGTGGGAN